MIFVVGDPSFKPIRNTRFTENELNDDELNINSSNYSSDKIGVAFNGWIANQAYFFIRDLCHFHQHHSPSEDTIIILQNINAERGWRNNILYSLHHYIIGQRRSLWVADLHRAQGVLAYAKSFEGISRLAAPGAVLQSFQFDAVSDSINARIMELSLINHAWQQSKSWSIARLGSYRGAGLALLAISCSVLISIMQPYFQAHRDALLHVGEWLADNFRTIFSGLLMFIVILFVFTDDRRPGNAPSKRGWFAMRTNAPGFRDLATLGMFSPIISGVIYVIISALLLLLIVYRPI